MESKRVEPPKKSVDFPLVNYIWVGPPPQKTDITGHDIAGPKKMALKNQSNPVVFWCLKEFLPHYQKELEKHNIACRAIEDYLSQDFKLKEEKEAAEHVKTMLEDLLSSEKNTIRDRTTIKVLFSYFILYQIGGYIADTNVYPQPSQEHVAFKAYDDFHVPIQLQGLSDAECRMLYSNPRVNLHALIDVWLMYSPAHSERAKCHFDTFYKYFSALDKGDDLQAAERFPGTSVEKVKRNTEDYHELVAANIIDAILSAPEEKGELSFWMCSNPKSDVQQKALCVDELGIIKYFYGTHRYKHKPNLLGPKKENSSIKSDDANQKKTPGRVK